MRKLKHHEQKLLKKVNFLEWKSEHGSREVAVMRRYHLQDREDYKRYNKICGMITRMVALLRKMDARDPTRVDLTQALLAKLHAMGVTPTEKGLSLCDHLSVSSFCRRRLAVMLVRLRMAETLREAVRIPC